MRMSSAQITITVLLNTDILLVSIRLFYMILLNIEFKESTVIWANAIVHNISGIHDRFRLQMFRAKEFS